MCVTAWIGDDYFETVGELRKALGVLVIADEGLLRAKVSEQGGDLETSCLCVIELEATAAANAMIWEQPAFEGGDPMEGRFIQETTE